MTEAALTEAIDEAAYLRVLGDILRRHRKARRWTRKELNRRLPSGVSLQTLATYELGTRTISVPRFVEICLTLGERPHDVLREAHEKTVVEPEPSRMRIDLLALAVATQPALRPLRSWAAERADQLPLDAPAVVDLDQVGLDAMAALCGIPLYDLVRSLRQLPANS